ncbi:hypothetical protein ERO13_D04G025400v2 [Gossypium hirsutum]|nr:hypothetical protein ERO13_D04G025400v2 [Gossypium hirsutum]
MEAGIASIGGKAGELAVDLIKQWMTYLLNYETNLENLRERVNDLKDARQRVQQSVDAAKLQGHTIYNDVDKWLTMVDHKIFEMAETKLKEAEEKANERCLIGLCPNFKSRYLLSKTAEKEAYAIVQLLEKGRFDSVSYRPAPKPANIEDININIWSFVEQLYLHIFSIYLLAIFGYLFIWLLPNF